MQNEFVALREIARMALNGLPDGARAQLLGELLIEDDGPRALERLSSLRAIISLRMQELIDEKFPLHELAEVYGDAAAVRARACARHSPIDEHPCFISEEEWAEYGAITGKPQNTLELIKARHAKDLEEVDPDFFPDPEHRVAYQRGLIDAYLKYEWPRSREQTGRHPSPTVPEALVANADGERT